MGIRRPPLLAPSQVRFNKDRICKPLNGSNMWHGQGLISCFFCFYNFAHGSDLSGFLLPLPLKASQIGKLILIWMANPLKRFWQVPLASFYRIQVLSLYCLITQSLCCLLPKQSKIFCVSVKFLMEHLDNKEKGGMRPLPECFATFCRLYFWSISSQMQMFWSFFRLNIYMSFSLIRKPFLFISLLHSFAV